ncbi:MAG: cation transporter [Gammaproteobacteria bacterium]|nr:cation transporter [Gammaproteobacteria bacterium]MDP6617308.1 cation transporter [Gammaproteobacteria bacterium]MDP6694086.1 cation transporter [Gammaproteobacteria bacterium]MDP7041107.1 cation transporter [Gammaproteobacteria bacterium]
MEQIKLQVEGMTCGGCVKSIQNALTARDGVSEASADLDNATVTVDFDPAIIQEIAIRTAIEDAGFDVAA